MAEETKMVSLEEARAQVRVTATRLALMHLAYARVMVDHLGAEEGKKLIRKAMMEYGRLVGERNKAGDQDLPYYGLHDSYEYKEQHFLDSRDVPKGEGGRDWDQYKVHGCVLSKVFKEYDQEELGRLYCYVDAAKSMAADPERILVHTSCELCGQDHCAFDMAPSSEEDRQAFVEQDDKWHKVDPLLAKSGDEDS